MPRAQLAFVEPISLNVRYTAKIELLAGELHSLLSIQKFIRYKRNNIKFIFATLSIICHLSSSLMPQHWKLGQVFHFLVWPDPGQILTQSFLIVGLDWVEYLMEYCRWIVLISDIADSSRFRT